MKNFDINRGGILIWFSFLLTQFDKYGKEKTVMLDDTIVVLNKKERNISNTIEVFNGELMFLPTA